MSTEQFNAQKVKETYESLIEVCQKAKLNIGEILLVYGNLGYALGASIENISDSLSVKELEKEYYSNPRPGIALMLSGLHVATWYHDWVELNKKEVK